MTTLMLLRTRKGKQSSVLEGFHLASAMHELVHLYVIR